MWSMMSCIRERCLCIFGPRPMVIRARIKDLVTLKTLSVSLVPYRCDGGARSIFYVVSADGWSLVIGRLTAPTLYGRPPPPQRKLGKELASLLSAARMGLCIVSKMSFFILTLPSSLCPGKEDFLRLSFTSGRLPLQLQCFPPSMPGAPPLPSFLSTRTLRSHFNFVLVFPPSSLSHPASAIRTTDQPPLGILHFPFLLPTYPFYNVALGLAE